MVYDKVSICINISFTTSKAGSLKSCILGTIKYRKLSKEGNPGIESP